MRVCPPSLRVGYGCTSGLGRLKRILPLRSHEVCGRCGEARLARTLGQQRDTQPVVHHPHQRVETGGLDRLNLPPVCQAACRERVLAQTMPLFEEQQFFRAQLFDVDRLAGRERMTVWQRHFKWLRCMVLSPTALSVR